MAAPDEIIGDSRPILPPKPAVSIAPEIDEYILCKRIKLFRLAMACSIEDILCLIKSLRMNLLNKTVRLRPING